MASGASRVLAAVGLVCAGCVAPRLEPGRPVPGFQLPALDGDGVDLQDLRGHIVIVHFWATWCPPCVEELPSLDRLHGSLARDGLVVLGVSGDRDEVVLRRFVAAAAVSFPVLRDPGGRVAAEYGTVGYPESFLVDGQGVLRHHFVGPTRWDTPEALDHLRGLLRSRVTSPTR